MSSDRRRAISASRSAAACWVAYGGTGGRVPEAAHQFGQCRACLRGEHCSGVAEVVPAQIGATGCFPSRVVDLVERGRRHVGVTVGGSRKEQRLRARRGVVGQVLLDHRDEMGRDRDAAYAGIGLGRADDELSSGAHDL